MRLNKPVTGTLLATALAGLISLEGLRTNAYLDSVGVPTICAGTTRGVKLGDTKTVEQCWTIAEAEYKEFEEYVISRLKVPVEPQVQIALTYFAVNVGKGGYAGSTALRKINAGDTEGGCHALRMWNKGRVNGVLVVIPGLDNRRAAEERLCLSKSPSLFSWDWLRSVLRF